jgi:hypothetical protein
VLRRSEGTCFSSPSDDEVGALQGAIRAERANASEAIKKEAQMAKSARKRRARRKKSANHGKRPNA